ncbi:2-amino-5-chloromuconate deaminase CnbZ [Microbacterium sp. A204]|uniref:2-amino-5-chloromuconate deaminase CnbZ n=1 Tax=Microbacterium sp. A204 TaxID=3457321 RepID=UPI003FD4AECC
MDTMIQAEGYAFMPGVVQYSGGIVATPEHRLTRVQFTRPTPFEEGLRLAASIVRAAGRPAAAIGAVEMRSPAPFSDGGFTDLNTRYIALLNELDMRGDTADNPIARSNVCPAGVTVGEASIHAFTFSVPNAAAGAPDYVISGSAEAPEGKGGYDGHIIAQGDTSPAALRQKAEFVVAEMRRRMVALGVGDRAVATAQVYTVHEVHDIVRDLVEPELGIAAGSVMINANPPVVGLEFEMDCRDVSLELRVDPATADLGAIAAQIGAHECV